MSERYFTVVLKVPEGWKPGPEFTGNEYFTAGSWSHAIHERDYARAALASTRTASDTRTAAGEAECDAALGRAAPASQQESARFGWQSIETAPKDGTNILVVNRKGNMATALWQEGGWWLRGGNYPDTFFNGHHGPTHWMPLPPKPEQSAPAGPACQGGITYQANAGPEPINDGIENYAISSGTQAAARTQADAGKDKARLNALIDWYLREGKRSEIHPNGHIEHTSRERIIAWCDKQSTTTKPENA